MRLIDADALIDGIKAMVGCAECDNYNGVRCRACQWDDAMGVADDFANNHPMPEQPEIVRCKDCIWYDQRDGQCEHHICINNTSPEWFCADGERKEQK